jgi:hypothetical protein
MYIVDNLVRLYHWFNLVLSKLFLLLAPSSPNPLDAPESLSSQNSLSLKSLCQLDPVNIQEYFSPINDATARAIN